MAVQTADYTSATEHFIQAVVVSCCAECDALRAVEEDITAAERQAAEEVSRVLETWWEQPAIDSVPWIQCKSCCPSQR